jgi:hypothetical protein
VDEEPSAAPPAINETIQETSPSRTEALAHRRDQGIRAGMATADPGRLEPELPHHGVATLAQPLGEALRVGLRLGQ